MYMVYGLEIECFLLNRLRIPRGQYHEGYKITNNWETQRDSSLYLENAEDEDVYRAYELVNTKPFKKCDLKRVMGELREYLDVDIGDGMVINNTCGAHIHFSVIRTLTDKEKAINGYAHKNLLLHRDIPDSFFIALGEKVKSAIIEKEASDRARLFLKQYYRMHAERINTINPYREYEKRNREFAFSSDNKGVEYRSFNLMGCDSWDDIINRYELAMNIIEDSVLSELDKDNPFGSDYTIDKVKPEVGRRLSNAWRFYHKNKVIDINPKKREKFDIEVIQSEDLKSQCEKLDIKAIESARIAKKHYSHNQAIGIDVYDLPLEVVF